MALGVDIEAGCRALQLPVSAAQIEQLVAYLELLTRWNRSFNLTAIRDPDAMVAGHILDSLSVLPQLQGNALLDVGSGAGLPGIPLAILRPEWRVTLLDGNGKKTRFMQQAVNVLGLQQVAVERCRVEDYRPDGAFDEIICRAFSSLEEIVALCLPLLAPRGRLLAMKGRLPETELSRLAKSITVRSLALTVPGLAGQRHLLVLEQPASGAGQAG